MFGYYIVIALFIMVSGVQCCPTGCVCQGSSSASFIQCSNDNLYLEDWERFLTYYVEELSMANFRIREQDTMIFLKKIPNLILLTLTNTPILCSDIVLLQSNIE